MSARHQLDRRSAIRQRLVLHLYESGPRVVLEAMLELEQGKNLDDVLISFTRIPASTYRQLGADRLPIPQELNLESDKP
jgi:hypothetical protein